MTRRRQLVAGAVLLLVAAALALLGRQARAWPAAMAGGDLQLRLAPARAGAWDGPGDLPGDPVARLLGVRDDVEFREALRLYVLSRPRWRHLFGERSVPPADAARSAFRRIALGPGPPARRSAAWNFLGVLAQESGGVDTAYLRRSLRAFREAVRADGGNAEAKFNVELLLRRRPGKTTPGAGGGGTGQRVPDAEGAGAASLGRGY